MGVKDLWNIITPLAERRPLYELHGKAVAIDLSGWIVDSQSVTDNYVQPKMYLRNLFFRTSFLLQQGIFPVFVLEGTAPDLKHKTIAKRNENRSDIQSKGNSKKGKRSQFNAVLKQCEEVLRYMGLFCLQGQGEAEALCAYLDQDGLVDGCISQDSDCFLYGAKKVYRNFCTKSQGYKDTSQGSVDVYTIDKIEQVLKLGRNKMIALALLCGCDYGNGVNGIGKEAALKLFKEVGEEEILDRLKSWGKDYRKYERMEQELSKVCNLCGHEGKTASHTKKGCTECKTDKKCKEIFKEKRILIMNELSMRKKAILTDNFPNQEIIDEFLIRKDKELDTLNWKWKQPKVLKFVDFMSRHLSWEPGYAFAKIFPLVTQWQLQNLPHLSPEQRKTAEFVIPKMIRKIRRKKGILCYEVVWKDEHQYFKGLTLAETSDKDNDEDDIYCNKNELISIEVEKDFANCYPEMAENFEESRKPKKKTTNRKRKVKGTPKNNKKIDDYVKINDMQSLEKSIDNMIISPKITPKRKKTVQRALSTKNPQIRRVIETEKLDLILNGSLERMFNEITPEDFENEDDINMSGIIRQICGVNEDSRVEEFSVEKQFNRKRDNLSDLTKDSMQSCAETIDKVDSMNFENMVEDDISAKMTYEINDKMYVMDEVDLTQNAVENGSNELQKIDLTLDENEWNDLHEVEKIDLTQNEDIWNDSHELDKIDLTQDEDKWNDLDQVEKVYLTQGNIALDDSNILENIDLTHNEFDIDEVYVPLKERVKLILEKKNKG